VVKLFSFEAGRRPRLGAEASGQLVDLPLAHYHFTANAEGASEQAQRLPPDIHSFIRSGASAMRAAREVLTWLKKRRAFPAGEQVFYEMEAARIVAPVPRPGKIILVDHLELWTSPNDKERGPCARLKAPSALCGSGSVVLKDVRSTIQAQTRIAAVMGERCKQVLAGDVRGKIFGFTAMLDLKQRNEGDDFSSEQRDGFCPMGPAVLTRDGLEYENWPAALKLNGQEVARWSEAVFMERLLQSITWLTRFMTLEPGDIVSIQLGSAKSVELKTDDRLELESPAGELAIQIADTRN
jgi:2-keto-4-pentenoate hydratase/2-oxohepta-3-ene-1,7-dioic acid hydratase in catechol pathway